MSIPLWSGPGSVALHRPVVEQRQRPGRALAPQERVLVDGELVEEREREPVVEDPQEQGADQGAHDGARATDRQRAADDRRGDPSSRCFWALAGSATVSISIV